MKLKAYIIDDEANFIIALKKLLESSVVKLDIVGQATRVDVALKEVATLNPDIVFLDVEMPGKNGFDFLEEVVNPTFKVIFITGHSEYAIKAIKHAALDYILKPITLTKLNEAISRVVDVIDKDNIRIKSLLTHLSNATDQGLILPSTSGINRIESSEINYIRGSSGSYTEFFLEGNKSILVSKPLSFFEPILLDQGFFRIHRAHMVNLSKVTSFNSGKGEVQLKSGERLPIAVRKRSKFTERLKGNILR